jgi:hypothetical protein
VSRIEPKAGRKGQKTGSGTRPVSEPKPSRNPALKSQLATSKLSDLGIAKDKAAEGAP